MKVNRPPGLFVVENRCIPGMCSCAVPSPFPLPRPRAPQKRQDWRRYELNSEARAHKLFEDKSIGRRLEDVKADFAHD